MGRRMSGAYGGAGGERLARERGLRRRKMMIRAAEENTFVRGGVVHVCEKEDV